MTISIVSDSPFRRLAKQFGAGLVVSEMMAGPELLRKTTKTQRRSVRGNDEGTAVVQIVGIDPKIMAEAARYCEGEGAEIIDINFGCPTKKVTKKQSGSAIMRDEALAARIMDAVVQAVRIPVTVKMRMGWDDRSRNAPRLASVAESVGVRMVTVHARTRCQMFNGTADWSFLREVKESVNIPVIANGDICDAASARECLELSGCDGVMVGRASRGRPWLPGQIASELSGPSVRTEPTPKEKLATMYEHLDGLLSLYGTASGLRVSRKHIAWYAQALHEDSDTSEDHGEDHSEDHSVSGRKRLPVTGLMERIVPLEKPAQVKDVLSRYFSEYGGSSVA
jgi:tRNA-dihydrouridine synthase B